MTRVRTWMVPVVAPAIASAVGLGRAAAQNDSKQPAEQKQSGQADKQSNSGGESGSQNSQPQQQTGSNQTGTNQSGSNQPASNQNNQQSAGSPTTSNRNNTTEQGSKAGQSPQGQAQSNQRGQAGQGNANTQGQPVANTRSNQSGQNANQANKNDKGDNRDNQSRDNNNRQTNIAVGIQFGAVGNRGLVINTVQNNSFFYRAGLRQGDVIVSISGRPIRSHTEFIEFVAVHPGERIPVIILRDGQQETVYIVYEENLVPQQQPGLGDQGVALLGVTFDAQIPQAAVIKEVFPGGAAAAAGLKAGDEIIALNGQRISGLQNATQLVANMKAGDKLEIDYLQFKHTQVTLVAGTRTADAAVDVRANANVQQSGYQQNAPAQGNQNQGQNTDNRTPQNNPNQNSGKSSILPRIR